MIEPLNIPRLVQKPLHLAFYYYCAYHLHFL